MSVPYDRFTEAFLSKITEFDFVNLYDFERNGLIDGYMKRAIAAFKKICKYDLASTGDDNIREFDIDIPEEDLEEIVEIVSEGMLVQWIRSNGKFRKKQTICHLQIVHVPRKRFEK